MVSLPIPAQIFRQRAYPPNPNRFKGRGFTLIEVLIATAVVAISGVAILATVTAFLKVSFIAQETVRAQGLANEKMEILKNMSYEDLATESGTIYPPGNIKDTETVTRGGHDYIVRTDIRFVDDPFDGLYEGTIPIDYFAHDYKKATIEVSDKNDIRVLAKLSTNIAANAAETTDDTGILSIQVVDSLGNPVPNANFHLTNPNPIPPVDIDSYTDVNGRIQIPVLPEDDTNSYHLEVSLPGYSTEWTHPDNVPGYNPVHQIDFNILAQEVTDITLAIDLLSTLEIAVVDEAGSPVADLPVTVTGVKKTHEDPDGIEPDIAKYTEDFTSSNPAGQITAADIEWDGYNFSVGGSYYIISTSPYQAVSLPADSTVNVTLKVTTDSGWPRINEVDPIEGFNDEVVSIEIIGANLPDGTTIELNKSGESTIAATSVVGNGTTLTGDLDLNGAATGIWNLVVTDGGESTTQIGGFTINSL